MATENLLENTDRVLRPLPERGRGGRSSPSVFSRGGSLLPSIYADARYVDAVIVSKARSLQEGVPCILEERNLSRTLLSNALMFQSSMPMIGIEIGGNEIDILISSDICKTFQLTNKFGSCLLIDKLYKISSRLFLFF